MQNHEAKISLRLRNIILINMTKIETRHNTNLYLIVETKREKNVVGKRITFIHSAKHVIRCIIEYYIEFTLRISLLLYFFPFVFHSRQKTATIELNE